MAIIHTSEHKAVSLKRLFEQHKTAKRNVSGSLILFIVIQNERSDSCFRGARGITSGNTSVSHLRSWNRREMEERIETY